MEHLNVIDALAEGDWLEASRLMAEGARGTIAPALVTSGAGASTTDGTSFGTSSVSPPANTLLLLAVVCSHATAAEVPNSVAGNGLTWTAVPGGSVTTGAGTRRVSWFYSWGAAPSAGAITIGFATSHSGAGWALVSCPGAALRPPRQATTAAASSTTITGTLAALEFSGNVHIYCVVRSTQEDTVPPAAGGWAEVADHPTTSWATPAGGLEIAWASGDLTADPTWTTSAAAAICSLEVVAA